MSRGHTRPSTLWYRQKPAGAPPRLWSGEAACPLRTVVVFPENHLFVSCEMVCFGASWVPFSSGHAYRMSRPRLHVRWSDRQWETAEALILDKLTRFGNHPEEIYTHICAFFSSLDANGSQKLIYQYMLVAECRKLGLSVPQLCRWYPA